MSGVAVAVSMLALSGCISAAGKGKQTAEATEAAPATPALAETSAEQLAASLNAKAAMRLQKQGGYRDPMVVAQSGSGMAPSPEALDTPPAQTPQLPGAATSQQANIGSLVLQPTGLNASRSSIYSSAVTGYVDPAAQQPAAPRGRVIYPELRNVYSAPATPVVAPPSVVLPSDQSSQNVTPQPADQTVAQQLVAQQRITPTQSQAEARAFPKKAAADASAARGGPMPGAGGGALTAQQSLAIARLLASKGQSKGDVLIGQPLTAGQAAQLPPPSTLKQPIASKSSDQKPVITNALYGGKDMMTGGNGLLQYASLPSSTRGAMRGLELQNDTVQVNCFKPALTAKLRSLEAHFGRAVMVTSGYRDHAHNQLVGGSQESLHTSCDAADIQIPGVSKWEIASYLRSLPDRGGVGTYCHTESVHVDTGTARDWNWGCGRTS